MVVVKKYAVLLIIIALLAIPLVSSLSFQSSPSVYYGSVNLTTADSFTCRFTPSGTGALTANVTWYVDGSPWTYDDQSFSVTSGVLQNSSWISSSNTTKHEYWRCEVTLDNTSTTNVSNSSQVEIKNTPPSIQDPSQLIYYEDSYYEFVFTANDPDLDSFSWFSNDLDKGLYSNQELFDILTNGTVIINETTEDLVGNHTMQIVVYDEPGIGSVRDFEFQLIAVNDVPVFVNSSLVYVCNETQVCSGFANATDEDNSSSELTYTFNETFINASPNGSFYFIPNYTQALTQNWTIEVNVSDGINTTTSFINLTIFTTNHEPNVSYLNVSGTQNDSLYTFYFNVTDSLDPQDVFFFNIVDDCGKGVWTIQNFTNGSSSTTAIGLVNTSLYSNDYVECRNVTISVLEYESSTMILKETYTYDLQFNISNINDAPVINEMSSYNTQENISDQSAALGLSFSYAVNATDVDTLTYEGDSLVYWLSGVPTFANGSAMFVIDSLTGNITAVQSAMNDSYAGVHSFTVHVNDSLTPTLTDSRLLIVNISYNYPPIINSFNLSDCNETLLCLKNISAYDIELSESLLTLNSLNYTNPLNVSRTNYTSNEISSLLGIDLNGDVSNDTTTYWINFTPDDEHVGAFALNISFSDDVGNVNTTIVYFNITNVGEAPLFDNNSDHSSIEPVSFGIVAETLPFEKYIYFYDEDSYYDLDTLNFSFSFIGPSLANFTITQINNYYALINFTADEVSSANYSINITLNDSYNFSTSQIVNFTVHDTDEFPNITQVTPFGLPNGTTTTNLTTIGNATSTAVTFYENTTINFDLRVVDDDNTSMNVSWYVDGVYNSSSIYNSSSPASNLSKYFSFFDNGTYNVTVRVDDVGYDVFTWNVTIENLNRPPINSHTMENMTGDSAIRGSASVFYSNFFKLYWDARTVFYDPDDDLNEDGEIGPGEINHLVFEVNESGGCDELATFVFDANSDNVTITPRSTGTCASSFTATDEYNASVDSNEIEIEVIKIQSSSGSSSSGTTTVTVTETVTVEVEQDVDVPESFKLIYPGISSIYENGTVTIPLVLKNGWSEDITGITLSVNDSANNLTYRFSESYIASLPSGSSVNETLTLLGYRLDGPFEFNVSARIASLDYVDSASIYVNALERGKEDIESLKSRIGFARDLLSDNPECAELVEILDQAEREIDTVSMEVINNVINGCKYLIGDVSTPSSALPKSFTGRLSIYGKTIIDYDLLFLILGALIGGAIIISVIARFTLRKI